MAAVIHLPHQRGPTSVAAQGGVRIPFEQGTDKEGSGGVMKSSPATRRAAVHVGAACINHPLDEVQVTLVGHLSKRCPPIVVAVVDLHRVTLHPLAQLGGRDVVEALVGGRGCHDRRCGGVKVGRGQRRRAGCGGPGWCGGRGGRE